MERHTQRTKAVAEADVRVCGDEVAAAVASLIAAVDRLGKANGVRTEFCVNLSDDLRLVKHHIDVRKGEASAEVARYEQYERYDRERHRLVTQIEDLNEALDSKKKALAALELEEQAFRRGRVLDGRPADEVKRRSEGLLPAPTIVLPAPRKSAAKKRLPDLKPAPPINLEDECLF